MVAMGKRPADGGVGGSGSNLGGQGGGSYNPGGSVDSGTTTTSTTAAPATSRRPPIDENGNRVELSECPFNLILLHNIYCQKIPFQLTVSGATWGARAAVRSPTQSARQSSTGAA